MGGARTPLRNVKRTWQDSEQARKRKKADTGRPTQTVTGELKYDSSVKLNSKPTTAAYPGIKGGGAK